MKLKCLTCRANKTCDIKKQWKKKTCRWGIAAPIIRCKQYVKIEVPSATTKETN